MNWTTQPCMLILLTLMVSEITSTFKMIFKSRQPFDEIHFDIRSDWLSRNAWLINDFLQSLCFEKTWRGREDRWGTRQQLCYT